MYTADGDYEKRQRKIYIRHQKLKEEDT